MQTDTWEALPGADFVRWTSHDWNPANGEGTAVGTLHGGQVTATGTFEGTFYERNNYFDEASTIAWPFLPHLAPTHVLDLAISRGDQAEPLEHHFTLSFGTAVKDPIIHLYSFASTLIFPPGTAISRLSGQDRFVVAGNVVIGDLLRTGESQPTRSLPDMNGSIRLAGRFETIEFIGKCHPLINFDGVYLQVGGWGCI